MRVEDLKVGERYKLPRGEEVGVFKGTRKEGAVLLFEVAKSENYAYDSFGFVPMLTNLTIDDIEPENETT